jgi:hypothetical protein
MNIKSPSKIFQMPIIGRIQCAIVNFNENNSSVYDLGTFDVIGIEKNQEDSKVYICDCWDNDEPQKVHSRYVSNFIKF